VTPLARVAFVLLVAATFAAFFVAQRLKSTPPVVQDLRAFPFFSPNQDGRFERTRLSFRLDRADDVTVAVVDRDGDALRTLVDDRGVRAGERVRATWDGRDDSGERVPDAIYRYRVNLRRQGRSLVVPQNVRLDTTPPRPRVLSIGPESGRRPELLPTESGEPARIRFVAPGGRRVEVEVWRTDRGPRRLTTLATGPVDARGFGRTSWDGTVRGRRVGAGTFRVVVRSRDQAGNIGESRRDRGGITVRYLAAQPPMTPVGAGRPITVGVDARGERWSWALRRVGAPAPVRRGVRTRGGPFTVRAPRGLSGAFLFEARTRTRATRVPVAVDDARNRRVLVVLPAATWQGRNPVDDDGDGFPNTLERGVPVRLARVLARDGLPEGFTATEGPLLGFLDRERMRYDLTTDVALAGGRTGPQLAGRRGVLIAGDERWLPGGLRRALRAFVAAGGALASFGTDSLRREVRLTPRRLLDPTPPAPTDAFGARLGPVQRRATDLLNLEDEALELFAGGNGRFANVGAWEETLGWTEADQVAAAVTQPAGRAVIVAARFGRGFVMRPGVPGFPRRLSSDTTSAELVRRMWTLLSTPR